MQFDFEGDLAVVWWSATANLFLLNKNEIHSSIVSSFHHLY